MMYPLRVLWNRFGAALAFTFALGAAAWLVMNGAGPAPVAGETLPRTSGGKPDLSGVWQALNTAAWDLQDHGAARGVPAGQTVVEGNEIPYRPEALIKKQDNSKNRATADPEARCTLPGVPRATYMPFPFQIVQAPEQITLLHEYRHAVRRIYMNSPHLEGPLEFWMGDSRARWDGDTLVVDTIHFNAETWFDRAGNFHSEALHVVERFTLVGLNHMDYEVTIEDPNVFTRPWKIRMPLHRRLEPHVRVLEYECFTFDEDEALQAAAEAAARR
jgi:hypothetical protein